MVDYLTILKQPDPDQATFEVYQRLLAYTNEQIKSGAFQHQRNSKHTHSRTVMDGRDVIRLHSSAVIPVMLTTGSKTASSTMMILKARDMLAAEDSTFKLEFNTADGWFTYEL